MAVKSKILVIGGTGYMGKFIVEASAKAGHQTLVLVREATLSNPEKSHIIDHFKKLGVTVLKGDLNHHQNLVAAIKLADVVIAALSSFQAQDQVKIISAIQEAGNVKRFLPAEFGNDPEQIESAVDPAKTMYGMKAEIRRMIKAAGIPYTFVVSNFFAGTLLTSLSQPNPSLKEPPRDKVVIIGDGNTKAVYVKEEDVAAYTIKSVDDPATLNKILYIRPPSNIYSFNDLVSLWEKKIGKTVEKIYVLEDQMLKIIQEAVHPLNMLYSIRHAVFFKGCQTKYEIEPLLGFEASQLYSDVVYTTVDEFLNQFV